MEETSVAAAAVADPTNVQSEAAFMENPEASPLTQAGMDEFDEDLAGVARLDAYSNAVSAVSRLAVAKSVPGMLEEVKEEDFQGRFPMALAKLASDNDTQVRETVAESLGQCLARASTEAPESLDAFKSIWVIIERVAADEDGQTRCALEDDVVEARGAPYTSHGLSEVMLPSLVAMAESTSEELKLFAIRILCCVSKLCTGEEDKVQVASAVTTLATDKSFKVRKVCAQYIGELCATASGDKKEQLLGVFFKLCADGLWTVRKSAVDGLVSIGKATENAEPGLTTYMQKIADTAVELSQDSSRWVRQAVLSQMGPIIHLLGEQTPDDLLQLYFSAARGELGQNDTELGHQCVYNLPGIALTLGPKRWPELRPCFEHLANDINWKTRRTLALALPEIAKAMGPQITAADLMPVYASLSRDLDEVKTAALDQLAAIVGCLDPENREDKDLLALIVDVSLEPDSWRFRWILAKQLSALFASLPSSTFEFDLVPVLCRLLRDPIAAVRSAAASQMGEIAQFFCKEAEEVDEGQRLVAMLEETLDDLSAEPMCQSRLTFCKAAMSLVNENVFGVFERSCARNLVTLASDDVRNVRCAVAETLAAAAQAGDDWSSIDAIERAIDYLKQDGDPEVQRFIMVEDV